MNDILLSNYFFFTTTKMRHYHYTDSRNFPNPHYLAQLIKGHAKLVSRDTVVELSEGDVFYIPMDYPYESFWYGEIIEWHSYCFTYFPEGGSFEKIGTGYPRSRWCRQWRFRTVFQSARSGDSFDGAYTQGQKRNFVRKCN